MTDIQTLRDKFLRNQEITNDTIRKLMKRGVGGSGVVDDELSDESANPVENRVLKAELDKKVEGRPITTIEDLIEYSIIRLSQIMPVIQPATEDRVELRLAIMGVVNTIGYIHPATLESAGLMTPSVLRRINELEERIATLEQNGQQKFFVLGHSVLGSEDRLH